MPPISRSRLERIRRILGQGGTLQEAADAIGCTRQNARRIAMHYNLPRRTYQPRQTTRGVPLEVYTSRVEARAAELCEYWLARDPSLRSAS